MLCLLVKIFFVFYKDKLHIYTVIPRLALLCIHRGFCFWGSAKIKVQVNH